MTGPRGVVVGIPRVEDERVSVTVTVDGEAHDVWFRIPGGVVSPHPDLILPVALLVAMRVGSTLRVDGEVSPRLLSGMSTAQALFAMWSDQLHPVDVEAASRPAAAELPGRGVAALFSGGVDSFYTSLTHLDEISALIYIPSFEMRPDEPELASRLSRAMRGAASDLGKHLIEIDTNVRSFVERFVPPMYSHGSGLAGAALALSPRFHTILFPSSHGFLLQEVWSTHPLLDPLWGTEELEIVNDGWDRTRQERTGFVASEGIPRRWLKVCWVGYNCGRCEKCVRTMVDLRHAGALEGCQTFPRGLDLAIVERLHLKGLDRRRWQRMLVPIEEKGDVSLAKAIRTALKGGPLPRRLIRRLAPRRRPPHLQDRFPELPVRPAAPFPSRERA